MAAVLETVIAPRSSALQSASLAPVCGSSVNFAPARRTTAVKFANFKGLKFQLAPSSASLSSAPRPARRGVRIACEAQNTAVEVASVSDATWQSLVLESDSPVLVEFWAPWCGPCRMIHPVVDELAKEYVGKLKCYKVNTDESPSIATRYGIRSIPTVIVFKNGEKKDAVIGAVPKSTLISCIEKFL